MKTPPANPAPRTSKSSSPTPRSPSLDYTAQSNPSNLPRKNSRPSPRSETGRRPLDPSSAPAPTSSSPTSPTFQDRVNLRPERERAPVEPDGSRSDGSSRAEVEKMREAMRAQMAQKQRRERPVRQQSSSSELSAGTADKRSGRGRVSPIAEEAKSTSSPVAAGRGGGSPPTTGTDTTTSSESVKTLKGSAPALSQTSGARTPSYPFPSMSSPRHSGTGPGFHRPFTALSPTVAPTRISSFPAPEGTAVDRVASGTVTPASTATTFQPPGSVAVRDQSEFPSPNLYEKTLTLHAEPGLDPWWNSVVQLMRDSYKADRLTLSVPADTTDPVNVPWGQKATFNACEEDPNSLVYLQRSSIDPSSEGSEHTTMDWGEMDATGESVLSPRPGPERPTLEGRHSFSGFEGKPSTAAANKQRPGMRRAETHLATKHASNQPAPFRPPKAELNSETLEDHDAEQPWQNLPYDDIAHVAERHMRGRMIPVLQALDYEVDPLVDNGGISKVLERGRLVILSRQYDDPARPRRTSRSEHGSIAPDDNRAWTHPPTPTQARPDDRKTENVKEGLAKLPFRALGALGRTSSQRGRRALRAPLYRSDSSDPPTDARPTATDDGGGRGDENAPVGYEEYEQMPASPWSQSPAPSPAIQNDPDVNPFFAEAKVDEDSFNPVAEPEDYSQHRSIEAIGVDQATTIIHIPLIHPLLSRPLQRPHRDEGNPDGFGGPGQGGTVSERKMPIAILSVLTPLIPYPSNLTRSLRHLAPHLATSFSLARQYTKVETEAAGLLRRPANPPSSIGLSSGQQLEDLERLSMNFSPLMDHIPMNGSVASPSEYSSISKSSPGGSLAGTPGYDAAAAATFGFSSEKPRTPASDMVDGYFQSQRQAVSRTNSGGKTDQGPGASSQAKTTGQSLTTVSRGASGDERHHRRHDSATRMSASRINPTSSDADTPSSRPEQRRPSPGEGQPPANQGPPILLERPSQESEHGLTVRETTASSLQTTGQQTGPRRQAMASVYGQGSQRPHSLLHSYGADFNATFQTLPTATMPITRTPVPPRAHSRSASESTPARFDMPPPSERLLRTIIDSIPVQIFTAAPQSGAITWVNSRFLTYRGQSVEDFLKDPWLSIHPEQRGDYMRDWNQSLRNGEQFSYQVRIRRFDGNYRWFFVRAAPLRDTRGITVHWFGTTMDIHEQHIAEVNAARQQETAASEAKYRSLANSSPQIVFAATDAEGITFANTQWLTYSGQRFEDALGLGFMEHVHADDLAKCKLPIFGEFCDEATNVPTSMPGPLNRNPSVASTSQSEQTTSTGNTNSTGATVTDAHRRLSRVSSSSSGSMDLTQPEISELAKTGILKVSRDSEGKTSYSTEVRLRNKDGDYRWHLVRCLMAEGSDDAWFGTCTDINDHKLLEQRMKETMDSKTRFLSNMSHEIRTPLIGISGMVEFLFDTTLNAEQSDYCNTIKSSSDGLLSIVNDILDLSKIEAGMMSLSYEWFHIRSLIESVNDAVSSVAINKRLELNYVVEEDVPPMVKGDRARIRQILMNVLGNAVKFTNEGEVFAHCEVYRGGQRPLGENDIMLSFEIVDSGQGFTRKEAELIFKPFSQIDGSSTRQHGGSGLGLVISRQLVELHGGEMTGSSVPGKGSNFRFYAKFTLPSDADQPEMEAPTRREIRRQSSAPLTSLQETVRPPHRQGSQPLLAKAYTLSPATVAPVAGPWDDSPGLLSSGSSDPSIGSMRTVPSERSSVSSVFPDPTIAAIKDSVRQEATDMKLVLPTTTEDDADRTPTPRRGSQQPRPSQSQPPTQPPAMLRKNSSSGSGGGSPFLPPMYSILIVCPQPYSLRATAKHIEMTLPKHIPHQITAREDVEGCQEMLGGDDPVIFTHIVLNLGEADEIISFVDQVINSLASPRTSIVVLADTKMRNEVKRRAPEYDFEQLDLDKRLQFLHKPIKPSRFAEMFNPSPETGALTGDRPRSNAERQADRQKAAFVDMEKNLGNKGYKVLLVEDNPVNQKVLLKFLHKVGMEVETALDGSICTDKVFEKGHSYYSIILCDLHMPNKDGYQTCREIRRWERKQRYSHLPIIALSANVMADVLDKCIDAGFSSYVTKPVDFKVLSGCMTDLMDRTKPHELMRHRSSN